MKKKRLTAVSAFHFFRLFYRSLLLISALIWYIQRWTKDLDASVLHMEAGSGKFILILIWFIFMAEMCLRFFPSRLESPGCQKQFRQNYRPTGRTDVELHDNSAVMIVALIWVVLNLIPGTLYLQGVLDEGVLVLLSLTYSVCDMICILFFCPFQTWFLRNRCCSSCRIYNWDYAMMFTPLFFIGGLFSWTLLAAAIALLFRWEITVWQYPERFSENTNQYLNCANCTEKLCSHKKQLITFRRALAAFAEAKVRRILGGGELLQTVKNRKTNPQ